MSNLDPIYLIENERYVQCPFLDVSSFIRHCAARGVRTSREQLERFERIGVFYPVVRVEHPRVRLKIQHVDEGRSYQILGMVEANEHWAGDVREEYGHFWFHKDMVEAFRRESMLWVPADRIFTPWSEYTDEELGTRVESFYSMFQVADLSRVVQRLSVELRLEWADTWDAEAFQRRLKGSDAMVASLRDGRRVEREAALLSQAISDRYFPHTQGDRRSIRFGTPTHYHDWSWDEYRRRWSATDELKRLGLHSERVKQLAEHMAATACNIDPLENWYGLVTFVAINKKDKLKNKALLAQDLYAVEKMLRLFYQDATGDELPPPDESATWKKDSYYGKGVTGNPQQYLEFLANEYHLNPRPRLILLVEGDGEERAFGRLCEGLFSISFATIGVEVHNLRGIGNFGAKLRTFIDDHHRRNTLVFVVSDNEGNVAGAIKKLLRADSQYVKGRKVTKDDYFYTWQKCIELDNFTDEDIALALSGQSRGHVFMSEDVEGVRGSENSNALQRLFREKTGRDLDKPALLEALCERLIAKANESPGVGLRPPIGNLIERIIRLASMNHPPHAQEIWEHNQMSGHFGAVKNRPNDNPTDDKFMSTE